MTMIPAADAASRLAAVPTPTEWDVNFARLDATTWDVTIYLALATLLHRCMKREKARRGRSARSA